MINFMRQNKIINWLEYIENEVYRLANIFDYKLICAEDIGEEHYNKILKQFTELDIVLNDVLFELENDIRR